MSSIQQLLVATGTASGNVSFRAKGSNSNLGPYPLPSGWQIGDLHILLIETANELITGAPAGWTEFASSPQGTGTAASSTATRLTAYYRVAQSGDGNPAITGTYNHAIGFVLGFYGVNGSTPLDVTPVGDVEASDSTSVVYPSVTTVTDNAMILFITTSRIDDFTQQTSAATFAGLASVTGPEFYQITFGNGGGVYAFYGPKTTAGSTGTGSSTLLTATTQGRMTIAIRPA